jgi:hypothetical protein
MPVVRTLARVTLAGVATLECAQAMQRWEARRRLFAAAQRRALALGRPLVVVGDPDAGAHTRMMRAYDCGDLCVDLHGCPRCPVVQAADLTAGPVPNVTADSAVVFVSCVLEYVADIDAALAELQRMAGSPDNLFIATVQPWTLTAALYPGARWVATPTPTGLAATPVRTIHKLGAAGAVLTLVALALWPPRP